MLTFLIPRTEFALRVTPMPKHALTITDKFIYSTIKGLLNLPQRASREIVAISPHLGGGGYIPLPMQKDILVLAHAFRMLTCRDAYVREKSWASLREVVHRKIGRMSPLPSKSLICRYLTGCTDGDLATTTAAVSTVWSRTRKATRDLFVAINPRWEWSDARQELSLRFAHPSQRVDEIIVPASARHRVLALLRRAAVEGLRRKLCAKLDQGKAYDALTASRESSHFMRSGKYTRFCDWRFIHRARLNLLPLNAARKGAVTSRRCRVCRDEDETLPHVVNHCLRHSGAWIRRQDEILALATNMEGGDEQTGGGRPLPPPAGSRDHGGSGGSNSRGGCDCSLR
ncbi:uncharacterized protein LOC124163775 [Ischnura elegans]|uniref:uncharacterized protein LOC124163775 n=1 Tax=Ischnura elegans TaxID=197161 RepID=UPI001ED8B863|nr:uncharacterized protein LOC124163775 [Ischnura elegans]